MSTTFYIVDGWRAGRVQGQWVIAAVSADEALAIAEARHGHADFIEFTATEDSDHLFTAEENLTEAPITPANYYDEPNDPQHTALMRPASWVRRG